MLSQPHLANALRFPVARSVLISLSRGERAGVRGIPTWGATPFSKCGCGALKARFMMAGRSSEYCCNPS